MNLACLKNLLLVLAMAFCALFWSITNSQNYKSSLVCETFFVQFLRRLLWQITWVSVFEKNCLLNRRHFCNCVRFFNSQLDGKYFWNNFHPQTSRNLKGSNYLRGLPCDSNLTWCSTTEHYVWLVGIVIDLAYNDLAIGLIGWKNDFSQ